MDELCIDFTNKTTLDEKYKNLSENFIKCVKGYHIVNEEPIKESPWENINALILKSSGYTIDTQSNGSHKSGTDLYCSLGNISNKSGKYRKDNISFDISSYRLTTVCSNKNPGKIEDIIVEINNRKNFKYYSIIVREIKDKEILYDWYLLPSDLPQLNPLSYKWIPTIGKQGKNKGTIVGWETDKIEGSSMSIIFSMSSQLWINIVITEKMKSFIISSCNVNNKSTLNYIKLYERNSLIL